MTALQEAFARVGIDRVQRHAASGSPPSRSTTPLERREPSYKARLVEDRAAFAAMNDDDLEVEHIALTQNLEAIRLELRLHRDGEAEHSPDWRPRAERATGIIRARLALCGVERARRQEIAREAKRQRHTDEVQQAEERRAQRVAKALRDEEDTMRRFKAKAQELLPPETFQAIWAAVHAEDTPP